MTGTKPPLFAYFVKNRLPELTVAESLTFLHRDKVFFLGGGLFFSIICLMQDNIGQHPGNSCSLRVMKWILREDSIFRKCTNW